LLRKEKYFESMWCEYFKIDTNIRKYWFIMIIVYSWLWKENIVIFNEKVYFDNMTTYMEYKKYLVNVWVFFFVEIFVVSKENMIHYIRRLNYNDATR